MTNAKIESIDNGVCRLSGELGFSAVPRVWRDSERLFTGSRHVLIDLGGVTRADSAGLALLISWIRIAEEKKISIKFKNIPGQLLAIARVSGVEEMLPQDLT